MVCKYGAAVALKGVSCGVGEGEIVALVGANGAGKTTLLRTLSGLMHPAGGAITFGGQRIDGRRPHEILKLGVAHVPEGRMVIASMSVLDNIKMGAYLRKDAKQVQADIETMYEHFPVLKERRHQGRWESFWGGAADARGGSRPHELSAVGAHGRTQHGSFAQAGRDRA